MVPVRQLDKPCLSKRQSLNRSQLALVREAFATWGAAANLNFREVADSEASDIRLGLGPLDGVDRALGGEQQFIENGFKVRSNVVFDSADYPRAGERSRVTMGRALGIGASSVAVLPAGADVTHGSASPN